MSSVFKPNPNSSPGPGQRNQKRSQPHPQEPLPEKDRSLTGKKRNVFKLNLTYVESDSANEQNTANGQLTEDDPHNEQGNTSDTFQTLKDSSDCDHHVGNVDFFEVTNKSGDNSSSQSDLNTREDPRGPRLNPEGPSGMEKDNNNPLRKKMEPESIHEAEQQVSADRDETEATRKDSSTLNRGVQPTAHDPDFNPSKVSGLDQSDLRYENGGIYPKPSLMMASGGTEAAGDDHTTLKHDQEAKWTAGNEGLNQNTFDPSKPGQDSAQAQGSTLNGQNGVKAEMFDRLITSTTAVAGMTVDPGTNQSATHHHCTLNDQIHAASQVTSMPQLEDKKVDDAVFGAGAGYSAIGQICSKTDQGDGQNNEKVDQKDMMETLSDVGNVAAETQTAGHRTSPGSAHMPSLTVDTPPSAKVPTPPQEIWENAELKETVSETNDGESACVNQRSVRTPPTPQTTPPTLQMTPTAPETTPPCLQTTPSVPQTTSRTTPSSLQTTPITPQTTPVSLPMTPSVSITPPPSLQTTPSCSQTSLSEEAELPRTATPPPSTPATPGAARLRGYLMKRGGPLKAWKQRWFVFAEERNALVYFRTQTDLTPLGQVGLSHASFTCEGAEPGVFYLHTPERTVTLKSQTEEKKFYWLQQLQLRRWIHRPHTTPSDTAGAAEAELFPQLESVEEVNTEETTSQPLLLQISLKHPLIELQNSMQGLRRRSSNDCGQSVFHVPTPTLMSPTTAWTNQSTGLTAANQEREQDPRSSKRMSSPGLLQATPTTSQALPTATATPPLASQTTLAAGHMTLRRRSRSILRRSVSSWSERSRLQQELQDQKDLVVVLQKALELCQAERRSKRMDQTSLNHSDVGQRQEDLHQPTEGLEDLRRRLDRTRAELEELKTGVIQKEQIILDLKKDVRELSEKNQVKQQVIEKLSSSVPRWTEQSADVDQGSVQRLVQQNQNLQDDLKAFRKQNHFLNSEIHHLSGLWRTSTESQRLLMNKVSDQREQYVRVLRELQEVSVRGGPQSEALGNIIQDALSLERDQLQAQAHRDRDQYGFLLVPDFELEDIKLLIKIQAPDLRSTQSQDAVERPLVARWDQFMSSCRGELSPSPELKGLIRTGIPPHLRPQVWNWIVRTRTQRDQDPLQYQQLCEQMESSSQSGSRPWSRQIDLDLPRTLCTNHKFNSPTSPSLQQLRRILLAFTWENPSIGYCQGLNRIAGLLLLVLGSEEDAFWALKAVVETIMPVEYYSPSLVGSQADQLVLKDFMAEKLPRLSSHLDRMGVDVSSSTFTWFLVVFVEVLPSHILMPLWDAFLYEGSKVLFRFSLALFKLKEPEILQLSTPLELHQYFRVLPKTVPDYRRLSVVAFDELNPLSRRAVRSRRALHLERLQRELSDLRQKQSLFLSQRSIRKSSEEENAVADQEEALDNNSEED